MHKKIKQQFSLSAQADLAYRQLSQKLGRSNPNEVKREILEAAHKVPPNKFWGALATLEELGEGRTKG